MTWLLALDQITDADALRVGGKAAALAALHRAGVRVPPTVCLTTDAYELFMERARLRGSIRQELGRKRFADMRWEEVWDAALRIRNRFLRAPFPPELETALAEYLRTDGGATPRVVRSSAPGEDGQGTSFAGLHDSFVDVQGLPALVDAVRGVWASLFNDRALLYRRELDLSVDGSAMAVLLQHLVEGSSSGVAFGIHPTDPERMAVEAVYGLNQGLVDGTIEPDRWALDRVDGRVLEHVRPSARRRLVARGDGLVAEDVPAPEAARAPLDAAGLESVHRAVREAGVLFGSPQDVEWTRAGGPLVVLQSRPVTTAPGGEGDERAWYLSLTRSLETLRVLRRRVEDELLPALDREAKAGQEGDLAAMDAAALAAEIERRRATYDRWVDVYWREFIPLAHGIRLFGLFYNAVLSPEDPYVFMTLLADTPLLSVQRNRALARMADRVRADPGLGARIRAGEPGDAEFESALDAFATSFGDAVFADQACFAGRERLCRLVCTLADAPAVPDTAAGADPEALGAAFFAAVGEERRPLAEELLDLGRASYRLRDDDNLYLARLEARVLEAVEEGRGRLGSSTIDGAQALDPDEVLRGLRHPNHVVEPRPQSAPKQAEEGFVARPRQLVGQPAGPGLAVGRARVIRGVDDLYRFEAGEILVVDAIDPNMTFVVPLAAAVVERRGGMLVHGAIIAREYGLPCVTGIPDAVSWIATGDRVTVDGYLGIVTFATDE